MANSPRHSVPVLRVVEIPFPGAFIASGCGSGTGIIPEDDGGGSEGGGGTRSTLSVSTCGDTSADVHEYDT